MANPTMSTWSTNGTTYDIRDKAAAAAIEAHTQATGNVHGLALADIGAAPAGYGLGTLGKFVNSPDEAVACGFYTAPAPSVIASSGNMRGVVLTNSANWITQIWSMNGSLIKREMESGEFKEYEWVNPPMVLGVEYRTTERWNGYPVYVKLVDFGVLPASGIKVVAFTNDTSYMAIRSNFRASGAAAITLPVNYEGADYTSYVSNYNIVVETNSDASSYHGYCTVWYIKP